MKRKIIIFVVMLCIAIGINIYIHSNNNTIEDKNEEIEQLKSDIGATGDNKIYEVQQDTYNKKNVLRVKADIKYKVAFVGMIKQSLPNINEIEDLFNKKYPLKKGIWIEKNSRNKFLELLNNSNIFNSKYKIDEEGYLQIEKKNEVNEKDKIINNTLNSEKQYIIDISSICYIVDEITGEVLEYSFENIDKYQIYEYFEEENKKIIFITENKYKQLNKDEIIDSILKLLEI